MRDWINISVQELEDIISIAPYSQFHQMLLAIKKNDLHKAVLYEVSPGMATEIYNSIQENAEKVLSRMPDADVSADNDRSLKDVSLEETQQEKGTAGTGNGSDSTSAIVSVIDLEPDDDDRDEEQDWEYIDMPDEREDEKIDDVPIEYEALDETKKDHSENDLIIRTEEDESIPESEEEEVVVEEEEENVVNKVPVQTEKDLEPTGENIEIEYIPVLSTEENDREESMGEDKSGDDLNEDMSANGSEEDGLTPAPEEVTSTQPEINKTTEDSPVEGELVDKEEETPSGNNEDLDIVPKDGDREEIKEIIIDNTTESENAGPLQDGEKDKGKISKKESKKKSGKKGDKDQEDYLSDFSKWLLSKAGSVEENKTSGSKKSRKKDKKKKKKKKKKTEFFSGKDSGIVSEPLAELLANQGHEEDAIEMYEKLSLIFPEKSVFFAAKIEKIKNKIK